MENNADEETRTLTPKTLEPKSSASTNSATSAGITLLLIVTKIEQKSTLTLKIIVAYKTYAYDRVLVVAKSRQND